MSLNVKGREFDFHKYETGTGYEGSECHRLVKQLKELHEDNLRRIDDELGRDGAEVNMAVTYAMV
jgi:hypothetical protein